MALSLLARLAGSSKGQVRFSPASWLGGAALVVAAALPGAALGQSSGAYTTNGAEYAIAGSLPGDQVFPKAALKTSGGYLVWQDNITDGYGWGVSALQLDSGFSGVLSRFRVNVTASGDQNNPDVSMLNGGGAVFVWQGGPQGRQHIYARFLSSSNVWTTGEVMVNQATNYYQMTPAVCTLTSGNIAVAWASMNQAASNSLQDVYIQVLTPAGQKIGSEVLVNQFSPYNQRNPAIAALPNGGFVVTWISEQERVVGTAPPGESTITYGMASVDVFARIFNASGVPAGSEFLVNADSSICLSPKVAAATDGTFMIVWAGQDRAHGPSGLDIFGRTFNSAGVGGNARTINTTLLGDQYAPTISADNTDYLVAWTSLGQDGSWEGVFGQFLHYDATGDGGEFRVNRTTISHQIQPTVASDGQGRFLAVWTSFTGINYSYDLYAQRYVNTSLPLPPMDAPFVYAPFTFTNTGQTNIYVPLLQVSWPFQIGLPVSYYEVYVNGSSSPAATLTTNIWTMTAANGLTPSSTNFFQVDYVTTTGRRSPLSPSSYGVTWSGQSWGGVPWEWMVAYYGPFSVWFDSNGIAHPNWPSPNLAVTSGGPTLVQVFLTGADPLDPSTWLRTSLSRTPQGYFLSWNPQPGLIYQVQSSSDLRSWTNLGAPRFAAGDTDSIYVGTGSAGYYRIMRLR